MEKTDQPSRRNYVIHGSEKDYDALQAEETIREFCAFIRSVIARYNENARQQELAEARRMDLQHAIELTEELTDEEEHQLYCKLTEALRIRRICKHENMLLKPLYDQVVDKNLLNRLAQIQGQIGMVRKTFEGKTYACRTDVLDDFRVETITSEAMQEAPGHVSECAAQSEQDVLPANSGKGGG